MPYPVRVGHILLRRKHYATWRRRLIANFLIVRTGSTITSCLILRKACYSKFFISHRTCIIDMIGYHITRRYARAQFKAFEVQFGLNILFFHVLHPFP